MPAQSIHQAMLWTTLVRYDAAVSVVGTRWRSVATPCRHTVHEGTHWITYVGTLHQTRAQEQPIGLYVCAAPSLAEAPTHLVQLRYERKVLTHIRCKDRRFQDFAK